MPKSRTLPKTRDRVKDLTEKGLTPREVAIQLGISTQAVYWHLARLNGKEATA
jgi:hypothetical protein